MLFSERYNDLIEFGNGESKDHICGEIEYSVKEKIAAVMYDFASQLSSAQIGMIAMKKELLLFILQFKHLMTQKECPIFR